MNFVLFVVYVSGISIVMPRVIGLLGVPIFFVLRTANAFLVSFVWQCFGIYVLQSLIVYGAYFAMSNNGGPGLLYFIVGWIISGLAAIGGYRDILEHAATNPGYTDRMIENARGKLCALPAHFVLFPVLFVVAGHIPIAVDNPLTAILLLIFFWLLDIPILGWVIAIISLIGAFSMAFHGVILLPFLVSAVREALLSKTRGRHETKTDQTGYAGSDGT